MNSERRSADGPSKKTAEQGDHKLTVPKTPNLVTRMRARPGNVLSQADLEEIELEEIKKWAHHQIQKFFWTAPA